MPDDLKTYLGDGVYATFDGFNIWLETDRYQDGRPPERIALEPSTFAALHAYQQRVAEHVRAYLGDIGGTG